ncbi:MAG: hypothetical protein DMG30_11165 [Acidobacteria bacterium]|nr:MAG: hypothetical protein DMG30_11165 [Acidobacteriota bacterium]
MEDSGRGQRWPTGYRKGERVQARCGYLGFQYAQKERLGGREILRNLPQTKILILTIHDSGVLMQEMRQAGVHGYVRKRDSDRDLISAIQALVSNKPFTYLQ